MKPKPNPKQHVQFDNPGRGCGMGCWSIGCMGVCGAIIMLCFAGYYSLFHSSLPLRLMEAAIEESGEVEIEGLSGSLSSGFSADELRFKTVDDHWSSLTDIKFNYEGDVSIFGTDSLIITELSVAGGTIYAEWDPNENELDFDPDLGEEIDEELKELDEEFRDEFGRSTGLKEVRIDLVSVKNLKIINPETELTITVDQLKFEGFNWQKGDLKNLGTLSIRSSQMDLETLPSIEFADFKHAQRIEGTLRSGADHRLKNDVPFVFDFGVNNDLKVYLDAELFGGGLRMSQRVDRDTLVYDDFTLSDYVDPTSFGALPAHVNMKLEFEKNATEGPVKLEPGGSFELGQTRFDALRLENPEQGPSYLIATANVDGATVTATIHIKRPSAPAWATKLQSDDFDSAEELWARTLFGIAVVDLSDDQRATIQASLTAPTRTRQPDVDSKSPPTAEQEPDAEQEPADENVEAEDPNADLG